MNIPERSAQRNIESVVSYIWTHRSNKGRRVRILGRAVAWQIYKRLTGGSWDIALTNNRVIRCHPNNTSASSVLYASLFDYDEMNFILRYLRPADNFIDVGANVGVYTVLASCIVTIGEIHAFEPSAQALLRLKENIEINNLANVSVHATAVSDLSGHVYLTKNRDSMNHLIKHCDIPNIEMVKSVRLDDEVGGIDFAMGKMDIEGAELLAMKGSVKMLESHNPPIWLIEVNDLARRFGYEKEDLISFLMKFGYIPAPYSAEENRLCRYNKGLEDRQNIFMISESFWNEVEDRIASDYKEE